MPTLLESTVPDLRFALRQLRRAPGFALTAILTLALGIGAATVMASIVRGTLLAPLPYPAQGELMGVGFAGPGADPNNEQTGESADFLARHATAFSSSGAADDGPLGQNFSVGDGHPRAIRSLRVSAGYLPTLGLAPVLGRTFTAQEDQPGAAPTAVLSDSLWRTAFHADPNVIGHSIHVNADLYTVIGVMPADASTLDAPDLWQPLHLSPSDPGYRGDNFQFIGRLKPGASLAQLSSELVPLSHALLEQYPPYWHWGPPGRPPMVETAWPLQRVLVSYARSSIVSLSAAVLAVLLVACFNLAGITAVRTTARRHEIALRLALGAHRTAVSRLLFTESLLLALAGSVLGLLFAVVLLPALIAAAPIDLPQLRHIAITAGSAVVALLTGLATALLFGLIPAAVAFRPSNSASLSAARTSGASVTQQRVGRSLLVAQVAVALALLSAATLLLSAFLAMRATPSGVRSSGLSLLQVNLKGTAYTSSTHTNQFISAVEGRLRAIPGVLSVATANGVPLDRGLNSGGFPAGHKELRDNIEERFITPGYIRTAGTALLAGSEFASSDNALSQPVALISQHAARLWWPDRTPLGEYVVASGGAPRRVIGVVADARDRSLADAVRPTVYLPLSQLDNETVGTINGWFATTFLLRTAPLASGAGADPALSKAAAAAVAAVDPEVSVGRFASMQSLVDHSVAAPRFFSWLAGGFALFALLLTVVGVFGLLSYQVTSRTREIGVRMALGATRERILASVLGQGARLTVVGLVLGASAGALLRKTLLSLLSDTARVGTASVDTILGSPLLAVAIAAAAILLACLAASLLPARRAASINPTEALRSE